MTIETLDIPITKEMTGSDGSTLAASGSITLTYTPAAAPAPPPSPSPTSSTPIFGFNDKVDGGIPAVATKLGCKPIPGAKMFNTGMPTTFPQPPAGVTHPLLCFKPSVPLSSSDKSSLTALAKSAATVSPNAMLTAFQEGEHSGFSIAQIKAVHAACYDIVKAAAPGVKYGQCLMSYSASGHSSFGPLSEWVAKTSAGNPLDFYGFDTYPWSTTVTAGTVLDTCLTELKSVVPNPVVAVTELNDTSNIATAPVSAGGGAQWFGEAWTWAKANNALLFYIFASTARNVPWPPDASTLAELSTIAHNAGL